jgi:hypothetical protein
MTNTTPATTVEMIEEMTDTVLAETILQFDNDAEMSEALLNADDDTHEDIREVCEDFAKCVLNATRATN